MKLFCTPNSDIVNECREYFGFKLPSEIIPTRIIYIFIHRKWQQEKRKTNRNKK